MNNLSLSPTLFNICHRSGAFRRRFEYGRLNVCNVMRSLVYVLILWDVVFPTLAFLVVHATASLIFNMILYGELNPVKATEVLIEISKATPFVWTSLHSWITELTMILSCFVAAATMVLVVIGGGALALYHAWQGIVNFFRLKTTGEVLENVLTPVGLGFEWVAGHHNKFCVNISSTVRTKTTYTAHLKAAHDEELLLHRGSINKMSVAELLASVEDTRATLARYKA